MWTELSWHVQDPEENWSIAASRDWQVKNEVCKDHRSAGVVKEHDLVENRRTPEDMLLELPAPQIRGDIGQHRVEIDVSPPLR
jgi:hypothetical protein